MFGVNRICKLLGISKTTYYASRDPAERFEEKYSRYKEIVSKIIKQNTGYGIRRIKKELEEENQIIIGRDTLGKLLKMWGLGLQRKVRSKKPSLIQKILKALADRTNLLVRTKPERPLQALSSDITELKFGGGRAYLCVHKDVLGQMVYGWSLRLDMKTELVMSSLEMARRAIKKLGEGSKKSKDKLLIHQDRGSQYLSYKYITAVLKFASLSYSSPGTPTHNAGQESFFGRFKDDWREEIAEIESFEELKEFVRRKLKYYNYERRHTSTGLVTPWKYTKSFL